MSRIVFSLSFACLGVGLAWESSGNNVNCSGEWCGVEGMDVGVAFDIGKVFGENALAPWVYFDLKDILPASPLGGEVEASDTGKQGCVAHLS